MPAIEVTTATNDGDQPAVILDRKSTVYPARPSHPRPRRIKLSPSDLRMLPFDYIQKGLLFEIPPSHGFESTVDRLKTSLSEALVHFYPLAGRLVTSEDDGAAYVDCNDAGVDFIEASTRADVGLAHLRADDVPPLVRQLFALDGAVNYDGHYLPLLTVQVTWTGGGIVVGVSLNHAVADGTSLWHFVNSWAQLCRGCPSVSVRPVHDRSLGSDSPLRLSIPEADVRRFSPPPLRERIFHFEGATIRRLKDVANANGQRKGKGEISSFQALCGHVWRAVTRARGVPAGEETAFTLAVDCRPRLEPALPRGYFGNAIQTIRATATAGALLSNGASFGAGLLRDVVQGHRDANIREAFQRWEKRPDFSKPSKFCGANDLMMGSSPRFGMYDNDFGWGKPVAVRSGRANKFDGKMSAFPGREGGGSVDLEICLLRPFMDALEADPQFALSAYL